MLKLFAGGFSPKRIFQNRNTKTISVIFYFLFLMLVVSFPLNLQIVQGGGWALYDFTSGIVTNHPDWLPDGLPSDIEIGPSGMYYENNVVTVLNWEDIDGNPIHYVFAPDVEYFVNGRTLVFEDARIVYFDENSNEIFDVPYSTLQHLVRFSELKQMTESEAVDAFTGIIDEAFSAASVLRSVLSYTGITVILNVLLVVVTSAIFLLVRVKDQQITNFRENILIVISSMTVPSLVGFFIGIIGLLEFNAFSVVIFQFATPLIALLAMFRGSSGEIYQTK